jgi:hypothetical protein
MSSPPADASRPASATFPSAAVDAQEAPSAKTQAERTAVFRGNWVPVIDRPTRFGAYQFLPTPPPQEPHRKPAAQLEQPPAEVVGEEEAKEPVALERMTGPPAGVRGLSGAVAWRSCLAQLPGALPGAVAWRSCLARAHSKLTRRTRQLDILFTILDREKEYRSCITKDGTVYNNAGQIIGFVNRDTNEAGSASEMYLGCVVENQFDNVYQVRDAEDELCGWIDMGTASIKDARGGTVVDFQAGGVCKHSNGTYLGQFCGVRGFHEMRVLVLYLVLLDPGMCGDASG